ncbi:MAG: fibronectin type III domain-containing protein [Thermodesulfovibrionales bacterium]
MSISTDNDAISKLSCLRISHLFLFSILSLFVLLSLILYPQNASADQITLVWNPPTTNTDGTPLTDLAGYIVYYGTASRNYPQNVPVGIVTTYTVSNLTDGLTYYFAVAAYDTAGNQSAYSNEVSKTLQAAVQQYTLTTSNLGSGSGIVTSSPPGIDCGTSCSGSYNAGTVVTLTATPAAGSIFSGWSGGGCAGTGTCSFSQNISTTVTATFVVMPSDCTASSPSVSITPSSQTITVEGGNVAYNVTIMNNDSGSSCANTTFRLAPSDSNTTNFNASTVNPTSVTLAAGASTTITEGLTVMATAGQEGGTNTTTVTASAIGHASGISNTVTTGINSSGSGVAGPNSPTAAVNNALVGSRAWSSPTNIFAADNAYAAAVAMVNNQASAYLVASGFGFAIPTGATITGIQVSVTRLQGSEPGTATIQDYSVKIVGGGVITGVDHAATGNNWPTTNADYTYGSSSDTWGATWTPADINASNFGVAVSAMGVASDSSYQDALIDYVSIMVYYTQ